MSLDQLCDEHGRFAVLAIDHRDSLRAVLAPHDPSSVNAASITAFKIDLVRELAGQLTGVMLEPEYSIPQVVDAGVLPPEVGFSAALEAQGYLDDPGAAPTRLLDGWSPAAAAAAGAACGKLLVPYHPDHPLASAQEAVAADVNDQCCAARLPLLLEPLFFGLSSPAERRRVVIETVSRFAAIRPGVLKLPFPIDPSASPGERRAACAEVTERSPVPWVLLSGGGTFASFAGQLADAVAHGCAGFTVGRALWAEAALADGAERIEVIRTLVAPRFAELRAILSG